jgi:hypothetical protein
MNCWNLFFDGILLVGGRWHRLEQTIVTIRNSTITSTAATGFTSGAIYPPYGTTFSEG